MVTCLICDKKFVNYYSFAKHIRIHKLTSKQYYDKYFKKENKGICECGKTTKFKSIRFGYCDACSIKCSVNNEKVLAKKVQTVKSRYGVNHHMQNKNIKNKCKNTCIKKYGVENPFQNKEVQFKFKNTCKKNLGVSYPTQNKKVIKKRENAYFKKHGLLNPMQNKDVLLKLKNTCIKKYGVEFPFQNKEIKNKIRKTFLKNYLVKIENNLLKLNLELIPKDNLYARSILKIRCLKCNTIFETTYFNIYQGCGRCPTCYPTYKSNAETDILTFVKSLGFKTVENSRKIIPPYELDIYIPEKRFAIEYNGLYWHSEQQGKDKFYHLNKLNMCSEKDVQLIQIFEDEWLFKKEIVKHRLKQLLNVSKAERIHARLCKIEEIGNSTKNDFLNLYHIQGQDISSIRLGAFYNDNLVSVMTFSRGSIAKGASLKKGFWELNRFCNCYDYHIPGIASKLLTFFRRNYEWTQIYSYADRRWSTGNVYKVLGFIEEHCTPPNYWYVKWQQRLHRYGLRKRPDEPKDIPEWILRINEGYTRVWDCGVLKFILQEE